jgi:hypothetical protein
VPREELGASVAASRRHVPRRIENHEIRRIETLCEPRRGDEKHFGINSTRHRPLAAPDAACIRRSGVHNTPIRFSRHRRLTNARHSRQGLRLLFFCCKVLEIDEFKKPAGKLCEHCVLTGGCGVYDTRPDVCRDYCRWKMSAAFRAAATDKVGTLLMDDPDDEYHAVCDPEKPFSWRNPLFKHLVAEAKAGRLVVAKAGCEHGAFSKTDGGRMGLSLPPRAPNSAKIRREFERDSEELSAPSDASWP